MLTAQFSANQWNSLCFLVIKMEGGKLKSKLYMFTSSIISACWQFMAFDSFYRPVMLIGFQCSVSLKWVSNNNCVTIWIIVLTCVSVMWLKWPDTRSFVFTGYGGHCFKVLLRSPWCMLFILTILDMIKHPQVVLTQCQWIECVYRYKKCPVVTY